MGETDRYDNMHACENVGKKDRQLSKTPCEKEMLMEKLQIDTEMEMIARGASASLGVGEDRRVVQRVKLYMCVRGYLTACRDKHM